MLLLSIYVNIITIVKRFLLLFWDPACYTLRGKEGMDQNEFMTSAEVEKYLAISRTILWKLRLSGDLRFVRYRRKIYYRKADVERFIEKHSFGPK